MANLLEWERSWRNNVRILKFPARYAVELRRGVDPTSKRDASEGGDYAGIVGSHPRESCITRRNQPQSSPVCQEKRDVHRLETSTAIGESPERGC